MIDQSEERRWAEIALSTEPADRERAEAAVRRLYGHYGTPLRNIVWVSSPGAVYINLAKLMFPIRFSWRCRDLRHHLANGFRRRFWRFDHEGNSTTNVVQAAPSHDFSNADVNRGLGRILRSELRAVTRLLKRRLGFEMACLYTGEPYFSHTADYARLRVLAKTIPRYQALIEVIESSAGIFPLNGLCFLVDRPCVLHRDENGATHHDTEAAVRFRDGHCLFALHGFPVSEHIILAPGSITLEQIDHEGRPSLRYAMAKRYGWERFAQHCAILDDDPEYGTLYARAGVVFVEVVNRTPEPDGSFSHHFLPVHPYLCPLPDPAIKHEIVDHRHPQITTARNAVASTYGLTGEEIAGLVVRT